MSSRTGLVYNERFLDHDTGPGHAERPERLRTLSTHLQKSSLWRSVHPLIIDRAPEELVASVHTPAHVRFVRDSCAQGLTVLDEGDTHVSKESFDVALLAAGGVLAGVDAVMKGLLNNVFCAIRPPGHHAEREKAMGFCLFNNAAVGARYAQQQHGAGRIAIIDWDVHHGNGTQNIFYEDASVFYTSTHQYPFYPGTGSRSEQGEGEGAGFTLNVPLPAGTGEKEYVESFQREILPAIERFRPDLIIISAGFDAHRDDPLANMNLTAESFARLTSLVMETAEKVCNGRIVSILEGGYNLAALAQSVEAHLRILIGG